MHLSLLLAEGHAHHQESRARQWHLLLLQTLQHKVLLGNGAPEYAKASRRPLSVLLRQIDT